MAPGKVTKPPTPKRPGPKPNTLTTIEKYLELAIIGIQVTGVTINYAALGRYYGISTGAAEGRFQRARLHVKNSIAARDIQEGDKAIKKEG